MHISASRTLNWLVSISLVLVAVTAVLLFLLLDRIPVPPRTLGPYIERRASGHHPMIVHSGELIRRALITLDRGEQHTAPALQLRIGAQPAPSAAPLAGGAEKLVASAEDAASAIASARPGDVITFLPGVYRFRGRLIGVRQAGSSDRRITVRAERPDTVFLEFGLMEGFAVSAPYWTFENLNIRGVCSNHSNCEHAFHVTGKASHFIARNNRIIDFNAHFKINGSRDGFPDNGVIEQNSLSNRTVRQTGNAVTPIDLVSASHWVIRRNLISDFAKGGSDQISYGAFAKGGGTDNRFEQNVVFCEYLLRGVPGQRVGISLGGGGTGKQFCRDKRCITEQDNSIIQSNLIAFCSDDGIYINRSAASKVLHNSLIDTGGVSVRFAESSADVQGNLVDGAIRSRDDGVLRAEDNVETGMVGLYLGLHPVRDLYVSAETLNFGWKESPPRTGSTGGAAPVDLCGTSRPRERAYGAFEDFSFCFSGRRF
jgi:hypothetical protein